MNISTIFMIGVPLLAVVSVGAFLILRLRVPKDRAAHYFRCSGCGSKLRYYARQVGHRGMCIRCKERFMFPPVGAVRR